MKDPSGLDRRTNARMRVLQPASEQAGSPVAPGLGHMAGTGLVLIASGAWQWHARTLPCPVDPVKARACTRLRRISWTLWGISVAAFCIGGFFAFFPDMAAALFL